jgi:hypothetical protein
MPEVKVTYEITLGTILMILGGLASALIILHKVIPPIAHAASAIMVFFAEHRILVSDLAERRGVSVAEIGDLAIAEMELARVQTRRRNRTKERI